MLVVSVERKKSLVALVGLSFVAVVAHLRRYVVGSVIGESVTC